MIHSHSPIFLMLVNRYIIIIYHIPPIVNIQKAERKITMLKFARPSIIYELAKIHTGWAPQDS